MTIKQDKVLSTSSSSYCSGSFWVIYFLRHTSLCFSSHCLSSPVYSFLPHETSFDCLFSQGICHFKAILFIVFEAIDVSARVLLQNLHDSNFFQRCFHLYNILYLSSCYTTGFNVIHCLSLPMKDVTQIDTILYSLSHNNRFRSTVWFMTRHNYIIIKTSWNKYLYVWHVMISFVKPWVVYLMKERSNVCFSRIFLTFETGEKQ